MRKDKFSEERIKAAKGAKGLLFVVAYHILLNKQGRVMGKYLSLNMNEETERINKIVNHGIIQKL